MNYSATLNLWQLAGALVAVMTLVKAVPAGWRLTFGRRRHLIAQLRKIAPGVRHDYVESLLGEPQWQTAMTCTRITDPFAEEAGADKGKDRNVAVTVRTWPLSRLGYLVTWSEDDAVVMYGVTTTSWWFRPRVVVGEPGLFHARGRVHREGRRVPGRWRGWSTLATRASTTGGVPSGG